MAVLNIGDFQIPLYTTQVSSPSLKVMDSKGVMYFVPLISEGGCVATGVKELFYEEQSINTCKTLTLPAGCYSVEMRGGFGGGACNASDDAGQMGQVARYSIRIQEPVEISLFRGGDGNDAAIDKGRGVGGGASGVDSFIIFNDEVVSAAGGAGEKCVGTQNAYGVSSTNSHCAVVGAVGGAGSVDNLEGISSAPTPGAQSWCSTGGTSVQEIITYRAPAGGGSVSGINGAQGTVKDSFVSFISTQGAGTSAGGGDGGGVRMEYNGNTYVANGGIGGATVSYSCSGHTVYSYGGGGGGGICYRVTTDDRVGCFDGGDGASGSKSESSTSYIRVYRL